MDVHSSVNAVEDNLINNIESTFIDSLRIQDDEKSEHASDGNDKFHVGVGNLCGAIEQQENKLNMKCLKRSATFPYPDTDMMVPPSSSDQEADTSLTESLPEQSARQNYSRSVSLPAPRSLISAMKGSREKHGGSQMKLTVKWAPDVYDPVPTLLSHTVKNKKQHKSRKKKNEKKNGKNGQKGNSSRGSGAKEKKLYRKLGGTSDSCNKLMDSHGNLIEPCTEPDARDVHSQDSNCKTSFLKKSVTELHYSVAEAL